MWMRENIWVSSVGSISRRCKIWRKRGFMMRKLLLAVEEVDWVIRLNCIVKDPSLRDGAELERTFKKMRGRTVVCRMSSLVSWCQGIPKARGWMPFLILMTAERSRGNLWRAVNRRNFFLIVFLIARASPWWGKIGTAISSLSRKRNCPGGILKKQCIACSVLSVQEKDLVHLATGRIPSSTTQNVPMGSLSLGAGWFMSARYRGWRRKTDNVWPFSQLILSHFSAIAASLGVTSGLLGRMMRVSHKWDDPRMMRCHCGETAIKRSLGSPKIGGRMTIEVIKYEKMVHSKLSDSCWM